MMIINLGKYGHFLSGRSLPSNIVREVDDIHITAEGITLDFSGVQSCNQSFVNELFQRLTERSIDVTNISFINFETLTVKTIVEREFSRFTNIMSAIEISK